MPKRESSVYLPAVAIMNNIPAVLATLFSSMAVETLSIPPNTFPSDNDVVFIFCTSLFSTARSYLQSSSIKDPRIVLTYRRYVSNILEAFIP